MKNSIDLNHLSKVVTAIEMYSNLDIFRKIFHFDLHRADDIFHYMNKFKIMQAIFYKMSSQEKEAFFAFFNKVADFKTYDEMCIYIQTLN